MKLYTKTVCPKCLLAKSELNENGIEHEVVNMDTDATAREKIIEAGIMAAPVLEIDGQLIGNFDDIMNEIEKRK